MLRVLEAMGGEFSGSQAELAAMMGAGRTAAQKTLNAAAAAKLVAVATIQGHSTTVRLLRPKLKLVAA